MKVSIITVCFNSEETIRDTIMSVLNQSVSPYEYIIIDGLSTDKTVDIAKEYITEFTEKNISYNIFSEKDNGIYDAMNKGIDKSSGDIIGIINSDDWYEQNAVETVLSTYISKPFDMFYADLNLLKRNGRIIVKHSKYDRFPTSRHWNHPTTFVTTKTYQELGKFKCYGLYDDFEFLLRAKKAERIIVIRNVVLANFRVGGASNKKNLCACYKRYNDRYRCYRENGYSKWYALECFFIEAAKYITS